MAALATANVTLLGVAPAPTASAAPVVPTPTVPTFQSSHQTSVTVSGTSSIHSARVLVGDLNEDGRDGLVTIDQTSSPSTNTASIHLAAGSPGTYAAPTTIGIGNYPLTVALADLDGDHHLDLFASYASAGIFVFPGDGHGDLGAPIVSAGTGGYATLGDIDGDGTVDAVTTQAGNLAVRRGGGDGTFGPAGPSYNDSLGLTEHVVTADLNHDGKADIVTTGQNGSLVGTSDNGWMSVRITGSDGNPGPSLIREDLGPLPATPLIADLDGDHHLDVLFISARGLGADDQQFVTLFGDGTGAFPRQTVGPPADAVSTVYDVLLHDLNGDGAPDLVLTLSGGAVGVRLNDGHGGFQARREYLTGSSADSLAAVDMDGDGIVDLMVASGASASPRTVGFISGRGDGTFVGSVGAGSHGDTHWVPHVADFDGNGSADVETDFENEGTAADWLWVSLSDGHGGLLTPHKISVPSLYTSALPVSLGPDTASDLVFTGPTAAAGLAVGLSNGDGTFATPSVTALEAKPSRLAAGDFNEDGHPDVAVTLPDAAKVDVLLGDGQGALGAPTGFGTAPAPMGIAAADLNGDHHLDLVVADHSNAANSITVLFGNGHGSFGSRLDVPVPGIPSMVAAGDFDGDQKPDVLVGIPTSGTVLVALYRGDGNGAFTAGPSQTVNTLFNRFDIGDLNGDGTLDVAVWTSLFLLGRGDGTFADTFTTVPVNESTLTASIADMDLDGRADVVGASPGPYVRFGAGAVAPGWAPFTSWADLVAHLYLDLIGRAPTAAESSGAVARLSAFTLSPAGLVGELRRSPDNLSAVDPVIRLYRAYFLRNPDISGYHHWVAKRRGGLALAAISSSFARSSEFQRRYGSLSNRAFVDLVYHNVLGRAGDAGGVAYWTGQLDRHKKSRGQVMLNFSESHEYVTKQVSEVDAAVLFLDLLQRTPTALEFANAVAALDAGSTVPDLAAPILHSAEYAARATAP